MRALAACLLMLAACSTAPDYGVRTVTIHARVPENAGRVYLTGNLLELGPWRADALPMAGESSERVATLRVAEGTRLEYKVTLGSWDREGLGPSGTVMPNAELLVDGDEDATIIIADFKKDPREYIADWRNSGVIGRLDYWLDVRSPLLSETRHVEIWLPPQYDAEPTRRFPVIYMQDGQNLFDPRIANTGVDWGVDEAIVALANEGVIEPAIIVGVWSTAQRRLEYAPAAVLDYVDGDVRALASGEFPPDLRVGDAYIRFLADDLKPRVDAAYRTRTGPESTFVMGSSMGALISVYAMSERPDVFGAAAGLSMHWPVGVQEQNFITRQDVWRPAITAAFQRYFAARHIAPATHRIWVDHGTGFLDEYYAAYQQAMLPVLHGLGYVDGVSLEARVYPGANHNETAWRARLREPLTFLLRPRQAAN
jgi:enterochelin esterase-like enzyme